MRAQYSKSLEMRSADTSLLSRSQARQLPCHCSSLGEGLPSSISAKLKIFCMNAGLIFAAKLYEFG